MKNKYRDDFIVKGPSYIFKWKDEKSNDPESDLPNKFFELIGGRNWKGEVAIEDENKRREFWNECIDSGLKSITIKVPKDKMSLLTI